MQNDFDLVGKMYVGANITDPGEVERKIERKRASEEGGQGGLMMCTRKSLSFLFPHRMGVIEWKNLQCKQTMHQCNCL